MEKCTKSQCDYLILSFLFFFYKHAFLIYFLLCGIGREKGVCRTTLEWLNIWFVIAVGVKVGCLDDID